MRAATEQIQRWAADSALLAADIVSTVAGKAGVDPLELPALQETLDIEHLAEYLEYDQDGRDIVFPYAGYSVTVTATGEIAAVPLSTAPSPGSIAAALVASTADDPARGWQWEPFGGYHSVQYDRGTGERTLIYGEQASGAWIESDETRAVET